jgi:hypothetical protein
LLQRRDLVKQVALEDRRAVPGEMFQGRGHDVLRQAVQHVRQFASPGRPPRGEPLIAPPAQQPGPGAQRHVERELVDLRAVLDQADPAADPQAFITGRILDDSVERDIFAHDDLSHAGPPSAGVASRHRAGGEAHLPCWSENPRAVNDLAPVLITHHLQELEHNPRRRPA